MMKFTKYFLFIFIFSISLFSMIGLSSFSVGGTSTIANFLANDISVNVEYYNKEYTWSSLESASSVLISEKKYEEEKEGGEAQELYNKYNVGDEFDVEYKIEGTTKYKYYNVCTYKYTKNEYDFPWFYDFYWFYYEYRKLPVEEFNLTISKENNISYYVNKNGTLNRDILLDGYNFFYDMEFSVPYNFDDLIDSSITIYAIKSNYGENDTNVSKIISSSSGVVNLYDSSLGGQASSEGTNINVNLDSSYFSNSFYLNSSTINDDSTLNFLISDGTTGNNIEGALGSEDETQAGHVNSSDSTISLNNNTNRMTVVLNGDLVVNGTLVIGAKTGNNGSGSARNSYIIGDYTTLDLNGFNLIVNGTLKVYGLIIDSIGNGEIIVNNNATLYGLMTFSDGKGGNQIIWGYGKGQTPFTDYRFPYILSKIRLNYGSIFKGYCKINLGSLGGSAAVFTLIGNANSNPYLLWTGASSDYILITPYQIKELSAVTAIANDMFDYRFNIDIYANLKFLDSSTTVYMKTGASFGSLDIYVDVNFELFLSRVDFPVSCLFDINVLGDSVIELFYYAVFYPGSSLYVDDAATIVFDFINNKEYQSLNVKKTVIGIGVDKTLPGSTRNLAGGIITFKNSFSYYTNLTVTNINNMPLYNSGIGYFKKYINSSHAIINGKLEFVSGNAGKYILSGPISVKKESLNEILNNSDKIQTYYNFNFETGSVWFDSSSLLADDNTSSVLKVTSFQTLPLISNNKAFIFDSNHNIEGDFDNFLDVIKNNDKYYFIAGSDTILIDNNSNQDNPIDDVVYVLEATQIDLERKIILANDGNYYVKFGGDYCKANGITYNDSTGNFDYTNVTINLGKFISNSSSVTVSSTIGGSFENYNIQWDANLGEWKYLDRY